MNRFLRGLTLIEIMIAMAILTTIMAMALAAFSINENYRDLTAIRVQLYRQNKKTLDMITEELTESAPGTVIVINNGTTDEIRFQTPLDVSTEGNYTVSWGASSGGVSYPGCFTSYRLVNRDLVRRVMTLPSAGNPVAGTEEIKASDLDEFDITNTSPTYFTIRTTSRRNMTLTRQRAISATSQAQVYLLN